MDLERIMSDVAELAERLDIAVRHAPLGGEGGGLCVLKGRRTLFVDSTADRATQCVRSLRALAQLPEIDNIFITPELREHMTVARGRAD